MPNQSTPGHPYASQSVHVTQNPVFKSKDGKYKEEEFYKKIFSPRRPLTGMPATHSPRSPRQDSQHSSKESSPRSPRARTAPPGFKTMPPITYNKQLITLNFRQMTPWCREMYRWFTPDPKQGIWHDNVETDCYRQLALRERLPAKRIYHVESGLMPSYSGYVPGQKFRYGRTWARETVNANRLGVERPWESTSFFENRPLGA